jgi:hypothetical protein
VCNIYAILYNMHAACSAELLDSRGELADQADAEVTFSVSSGEGKVIATHNGSWETQQAWGSLSVILFLMFFKLKCGCPEPVWTTQRCF